MSTATILAFCAVGFAAVIVPGPDFAIVTGLSLRHGRAAGVAAAFGIAFGLVIWGLLSAFGLAAVVASSATAFTVIKIVGGGYLLYLGVRALIEARRLGNEALAPAAEEEGESEHPLRTGFAQGFLTNMLNPKAALFYLTLLPQFVGDNPTLGNIALLATLQALIALSWFAFYAVAVSAIRPVLQRRRARQAIEGVTGVAFVGIGLRLVLTRS